MADLRRPGTSVDISGVGLPPITEASPAQYMPTGLFAWGPVNVPTFVSGLEDFRQGFGDDTPYSKAPGDAQNAFDTSQGSLRGWINRVFETRAAFQSTLAAAAAVGSTTLILASVTGLKLGDKVTLPGTGNSNLSILTVTAGTRTITVTPGLGTAVALGGTVTRAASLVDDYTAKCVLLDSRTTAPAEVVTLVGAYPGAIANSFKTEIIPAGVDRVTDRMVRVRGRFLSYDFEWLGVPNPPTAPAAGADQATQDAYVAELAAYNTRLASAEQANGRVITDIEALADQRAIDFRIRLPENYNYRPLAITQERFTGRINAAALPWAGGGNGETVDNLPANSDWLTVINATPDAVFVGGSDQAGLKTGVSAFEDKLYGTGCVTVPGRTSGAVWDALIEHAEEYDRLALLQLPFGLSPQDAVVEKRARSSSHKASVYYGWNRKRGEWFPHDGFVAGLGARETARGDRDGGIKASWTGAIRIDGVEQRFGRDVVDDGVAELFYRQDVLINWTRQVNGNYRVEAQKLSAPQGATTRVSHTVCNNVFVYSIEPVLYFLRDRTIDRAGTLVAEMIDAIETFLSDYGPDKPAPRGDTFWDAAVILDSTTVNDLNNATLSAQGEFSYAPHAEKVRVRLNQHNITSLTNTR